MINTDKIKKDTRKDHNKITKMNCNLSNVIMTMVNENWKAVLEKTRKAGTPREAGNEAKLLTFYQVSLQDGRRAKTCEKLTV